MLKQAVRWVASASIAGLPTSILDNFTGKTTPMARSLFMSHVCSFHHTEQLTTLSCIRVVLCLPSSISTYTFWNVYLLLPHKEEAQTDDAIVEKITKYHQYLQITYNYEMLEENTHVI